MPSLFPRLQDLGAKQIPILVHLAFVVNRTLEDRGLTTRMTIMSVPPIWRLIADARARTGSPNDQLDVIVCYEVIQGGIEPVAEDPDARTVFSSDPTCWAELHERGRDIGSGFGQFWRESLRARIRACFPPTGLTTRVSPPPIIPASLRLTTRVSPPLIIPASHMPHLGIPSSGRFVVVSHAPALFARAINLLRR